MKLVNQPTPNPTRKVMATVVVGCFLTVAAWVANDFYSLTIPNDVQAAIHTAAATLVAYFVRDRLN